MVSWIGAVVLAASVTRVAVLPPSVTEGVQPEVAAFFAVKLQEVIQGLDREAIGLDDVRAILGVAQLNEDLGCHDAGCLAELAGLLGVDEIVHGSAGHVDGAWLVALKRVRRRDGRVLATVSRVLPEVSQLYLVQAAEPMGRELYGAAIRIPVAIPLGVSRARDADAWDAWLWATSGISLAAATGLAIASVSIRDGAGGAASERGLQGMRISGAALAAVGLGATAAQIWRIVRRRRGRSDPDPVGLRPGPGGIAVAWRW